MPKLRETTAPKGVGNRGKGRPKGVPNKATANAREAIGRFIDGNAERVQGWLDEIAATDGPKEAMRAYVDLLEFHVPKLARTELTGDGGGPVQVKTSPADHDL